MDRVQTYEGWRSTILAYVETEDSLWRAIGVWLYPKRGVSMTSFNHLCEENFKRRTSETGTHYECEGCGEEVPDGIKMIALLEKLP